MSGTDPLEFPQLDDLFASALADAPGRRVDELLPVLAALAERPLVLGGVIQTEEFALLTLRDPRDGAKAGTTVAPTARLGFGRSVGLLDADGDFCGLVSNHVGVELDAPPPTSKFGESSPSGATIEEYHPDGEGFRDRLPSPRHVVELFASRHPELLAVHVVGVTISPFGDVDIDED
jgi:hypothetical protein